MNEIEKQVSPIKKALFYGMELVGFNPKNFDKHSLHIIINNIELNHKNISVGNFREAFELGANGKLDVNLNTYQNFNTMYVANVFGAYRRFKINKRKLDTFKLPEPENNKQWEMWEKKKHFEWLRDKVFLESSKKNGSSGQFPEILIASFKDIYDYMLSERMLNEKMGVELKDRIAEAERAEVLEQKNPKKAFGMSLNKKRNDSKIPPCFYKLEVVDWFKLNKNKLN